MPGRRMQSIFHTVAIVFLAVEGLWAGEFESLEMRLEQNATDHDIEVVFSITSGDEGLIWLKVKSPEDMVLIDFTAEAPSMGQRHLSFESPEPSDYDKIKAAYPEGNYKFEGKTTSGEMLRGTATLKYALPAAVEFIGPKAGAEDKAIEGLSIRWRGVSGSQGYLVEVEQEELNLYVKAKVGAETTSFRVPPGYLEPGLEYKAAVASMSTNGNLTFVETVFSTAD